MPSVPRFGLLLIDLQQGFDHPTHWGASRSTPNLEENISLLLGSFRKAVEPGSIFHIYHQSLSPTSPLYGNVAFQPYATPHPNEPTFSKNVNSAFIGTNLESAIRKQGITHLVVAGLTTDHCVSTSVRMAANLGVVAAAEGQSQGRILLVKDATAAYEKSIDGLTHDAELVHSVNLASLNNEFCEAVSTNEAIWELERIRE